MATFTVTKRKNKTSTSWQYDVKHPSFKSGKKRKSGFKTKAEATNAAQQLIRDLEDGLNVESNTKFTDYYKSWLVASGKNKLSERRQYCYDQALRLLLEHFGENVLIKILAGMNIKILLQLIQQGELQKQLEKYIYVYLLV